MFNIVIITRKIGAIIGWRSHAEVHFGSVEKAAKVASRRVWHRNKNQELR